MRLHKETYYSIPLGQNTGLFAGGRSRAEIKTAKTVSEVREGRKRHSERLKKMAIIHTQKQRALKILSVLRKIYPDAKCALNFGSPFELLVATILSAQCTDQRVNIVTRELFKKYRSVEAYTKVDLEILEQDIRSTGFYKNKARHIRSSAEIVLTRFRGRLPETLEDLTSLPGVGRKTANVVLGNAFGIPGITVDTHMIRLNRRLGLTREKDPVKIEYELMPLLPRKEWTHYSHLIIRHGRERCFARNPDCFRCPLARICPSAGLA